MKRFSIPDWPKLISSVCERGIVQLGWGMPEQWLQVELFAALCREADVSGWQPLDTEVPYRTYYPVVPPKSADYDWRRYGAIKWIDLCVRNEVTNHWCWFELKVRHAGIGDRESEAAKLARDAFVKDYVGLLGLDVAATSHIWREPDEHTKAYWFEDQLAPLSNLMLHGTHLVVSAYLQIGGTIDYPVFTEPALRYRISSWLQTRAGQTSQVTESPPAHIQFAEGLPGGQSMILCCSEKQNAINR